MKNLGYYNGEYGLLEDMKVPMLDRACYFGDGCYDATYCHNHKIYTLDAHIDRFYNSASMLNIKVPKEKNELKELLQDMVNKVDDGDQFVYWQVSRGSTIRNHAFPDENQSDSNLWIMLKPSPVQDTYRKVKLITLEDTRFLHCNIKTLNLIPSCMAAQKAAMANCDEAVFHRGDIVTECAHSNISIIKDGVLKTHPTDNYILPGVARANLIEMCNRFDFPVKEESFTLDEMMAADEVIMSSCGSFCLAAETINGKTVGGKAPRMLKMLQDALLNDFMEACAAD